MTTFKKQSGEIWDGSMRLIFIFMSEATWTSAANYGLVTFFEIFKLPLLRYQYNGLSYSKNNKNSVTCVLRSFIIAIEKICSPYRFSLEISMERSTTFNDSIPMPIACIQNKDIRSKMKTKFNQFTWLDNFEIKIHE